MAILSGHKKQTKTVTDANGDHIRVSRWTHADTVHLSNGLTLNESVVYLKQADWDALGDEKYTNNVEYRITDATSEVHGSVVGVKGDAESSYRDGEVNITAENIGLGNVPNVSTNDQTPTYTVASSNTALSSGEKLSVAFGKIAKAVSSLIAHLADTVPHVTSADKTKWNGYANSITTNANAISTLNNDLSTITNMLSFRDFYTGNIDELHGNEKRGTYFVAVNDASGTQPFGSGLHYTLFVGILTDNIQIAIRLHDGAIKARTYGDFGEGWKWYDWTKD